jgi:pimeloyl-ACP methyl ester carboxylesterase
MDIFSQAVDRRIDLGTHTLHAVVNGKGSPAVVFDGGLGMHCNEYRALQDRIAPATTVVVYNRAGYGFSGAGPLPRDSRREVEELRAMLLKLKIAPPYILVGHSIGGLNNLVFADLHPDEVAGMVLLDPPPLPFILGEEYAELASMADRMTDEWQGIANSGLDSDNEEERSNAEFYQMIASEHREMFNLSAKQVSNIVSFANMPLVVIASGVPNPMFGELADSFQKFWAKESEAISGMSNRGQFIYAETSSHRLHTDVEALVAEKILTTLTLVKAMLH